MKRNFLCTLTVCLLLFACKSAKNTNSNMSKLNGTWELNYITGKRIAFEGLYPGKKPEITFDVAAKRASGNTSCNSFSGGFTAEENKISFSEAMAMTKMACPGEGEQSFIETLRKITAYSFAADGSLNLLMGDVEAMRFSKK